MSYTHRRAIGLIAGPDKPPFTLLRTGSVVSTSIAIALNVFTAVNASAPAQPLTSNPQYPKRLANFTINGLLMAALNCSRLREELGLTDFSARLFNMDMKR
jgi:hypothetical protein